tara:strand:- start:4 stop:627 length:624 start_codon:yes stop_codon:yes gene_type:complete
MDTASLEKQAIQAAINGNWQQAIELNQKILKQKPENIASLNRLAKAFWQTGDLASTKKTYQKSLKIDQYNLIAQKNLKRLADQRKKRTQEISQNSVLTADFFIGEPGKSKVVKLLRLTSPKILAELHTGDQVLLTPKKHFIAVNKEDKTYLGSLPEDLSQRLISLIKGGNRYEAFVKAVDRQDLEIFIKEIFRSRQFRNLPSFNLRQ